MRISHTCIDRPIAPAVISVIITILGAVSFSAPADCPISRDRAALDPSVTVPISGRQRRGGRLDRGHADRAADQRRREHDLYRVELDRRRPFLHRGQLRARYQSRHCPGAGPEPRRHRQSAPAGGCAQYRRHGAEGVARPDGRHAPLFAGQVARPRCSSPITRRSR